MGFRKVGNLRLAMNRDRMDEYHQYAATANTIGVNVQFLSPAEIKKLWPLCTTADLVGGILHPDDGYIQPADVTQALARGECARRHHLSQHCCPGDRRLIFGQVAGKDLKWRHPL